MEDKANKANLTEYGRKKARRVVRPVLGAEAFGLADACDYAIVIQHHFR